MRFKWITGVILLALLSGCSNQSSCENDLTYYGEVIEEEEISSDKLSLTNFDEVTNQEIVDLFSSYGVDENSVSYFYYNEETDIYVHVNESLTFMGASTTKLPTAMYYYDQIRDQTRSLDDLIEYCQGCYEEGGSIGFYYEVGDLIRLQDVLYYLIVESDNTAMNMLVNDIGLYSEYRTIILESYSEVQFSEEYYQDNYITSAYEFDVLYYLYNHSNQYETLINHMKMAQQDDYLAGIEAEVEIAHKYGWYEDNVHDYGIVYTTNSYLVGIYTYQVSYPESFISELNQIFYDYTVSYGA